jgi:urease accessory protein UreF
MGSHRFIRGRCGPAGGGRAAAAVVVAALLLGGCGGPSSGAASDSEKAADAAALNAALAGELTVIDAYGRGLRLLEGARRAAARQFLAQDKEDVDAVAKALRGLGARAEAEAEELDFSGIGSGADFLRLAYELEGAALGAWLDAVPRLYEAAPRHLAASLAAGHAQRLVVLRQALGARLAEAVPEAFDGGEVPAPGAAPTPEAAEG